LQPIKEALLLLEAALLAQAQQVLTGQSSMASKKTHLQLIMQAIFLLLQGQAAVHLVKERD
jgi:hypothetical protein